jgi:RNA polymerase sigma-70 factor (ECF subfamily)
MVASVETSPAFPAAPWPCPDVAKTRPAELSDSEIVERAQLGDAAALPVLVKRYSRRVFRICSAITRDSHDAEDCLQKTFLLVLQKISQFRGEAQFSTWLTRIAVNVALSHRRRRASRNAPEVPIEAVEDGTPSLQIVDRREDPERACSRAELRRLLQNEIRRLPPLYRMVLILRDVEELSTEETARILGITEPAVKTRLMRARLKMRHKLSAAFGRASAAYSRAAD